MEEIKVGEYIRTRNGCIEKVKDILTIEENKFYYTDIFLSFTKEQIAKHSPNIIDLIEVGDYVNGILIDDICKFKDGSISLNNEPTYKCGIKSIVTHEQFNSIKYEVI